MSTMSLHMDVETIHDDLSSVLYEDSEQLATEVDTDSMAPVADENSESSGMDILTCKLCRAMFYSESDYADHVSSHMTDGDDAEQYTSDSTSKCTYSCGECGKQFTQQGNVKIHMRVHNKERPYACTTCGKSFTQLGNLQTHMHIHLDTKPFVCDVCLRGFTQAGNVKKHRETVHEGKPPLECDACGESCATPTKLSIHARTHIAGSATKPERTRRTSVKLPRKDPKKPKSMSNDDNGEDIEDGNVSPALVTVPSVSKPDIVDIADFDLSECKRLRMEVYYCMICKQAFKSDPELSMHLSLHK